MNYMLEWDGEEVTADYPGGPVRWIKMKVGERGMARCNNTVWGEGC